MGFFRRGKKTQTKGDAENTHERGASAVVTDTKITKSILKNSSSSFPRRATSQRSSIVSTVWKVTQRQMEECEDVFSLFADENQLVKDIHVVKMFEALGCNIDAEELTKILETVKQKGGKMDFSTFVQSVAPHIIDDSNQVYYSEENIKLAFERFDLDKDGFISASELRHVLTEAFCQGMRRVAETLDDADIEEVMAEADLDGDGRISYEEFHMMIPHLSVGIQL